MYMYMYMIIYGNVQAHCYNLLNLHEMSSCSRVIEADRNFGSRTFIRIKPTHQVGHSGSHVDGHINQLQH